MFDKRLGVRFRASDKVDMDLNYHHFSTAAKLPNLKKALGSEVDYQINWSVMKDVKLSAGYSFMRGTETMDVVKGGNHKAGKTGMGFSKYQSESIVCEVVKIDKRGEYVWGTSSYVFF